LPHLTSQDEIVTALIRLAHNVPMTTQPPAVSVREKLGSLLRRLSVATALLACCLVFAQCSSLSSPSAPTPEPSGSTDSPQVRTITAANLIKPADLPPPIGGGKVITYTRNARSLDQLSICQPQPLTALGAAAIKSRSFKSRYEAGNRPFPHSSLDDQPDSYAVVLQFPDPMAAQRAKALYDSWVTSCEAGTDLPAGIRKLSSSFSWTPVAADPAQAEVSEVRYQRDGSSSRYAFFESVGLTVLEDRMMITVHLFYTDESVYSLNTEEEEGGFAHPQLGLVGAAAKRLSE
jgi:hypothetical protein